MDDTAILWWALHDRVCLDVLMSPRSSPNRQVRLDCFSEEELSLASQIDLASETRQVGLDWLCISLHLPSLEGPSPSEGRVQLGSSPLFFCLQCPGPTTQLNLLPEEMPLHLCSSGSFCWSQDHQPWPIVSHSNRLVSG